MKTAKCSPFFSDFTFPYGFYGVDEYRRWLAEAGLNTRRVELIPKDMKHKGRDGFADWIRSTWLPYLSRIPEQMQAEFIEAISNAYLVRHPRMMKVWSTWIWLGGKWRLSSFEYRGGSAIDEGFETVTASCPIPIVMAGGKKVSELGALTMTYNAVQQLDRIRNFGDVVS